MDITSILLSSIKRVTSEIYKSAKGPIKEKIGQVRSEKQVQKIGKYVELLDQIKTLYQPDKKVSLQEVYFPLSITVDQQDFVPSNADELLVDSKCILIEGTAGHGKSLFMRHMCIKELYRGRYIPILVQLRKLKDDENLIDLIIREFNLLGFDRDEKLLVYFWRKGRVLLLLDGFDEIKSSKNKAIENEIEMLIRRFDKSKMIISSRPNTGLKSSFYIDNVRLSNLSSLQQIEFVNHLIPDEGHREIIVSAIRSSKFIDEVVRTPLLITLLLIAYQAEARIPSSLIEFYHLLFPTLLCRHDDMKLGFSREKKSGIGRYRLQELFEVFSYLTAKHGKVRFNTNFFDRMLIQSRDYMTFDIPDGEFENIQHDIVKITCLIVEDGYEEYSYIHKSIQEFYSASFIERSGESVIESFYTHTLKNFKRYVQWSQVINFLQGLNEYLYYKRFLSLIYGKFVDKRSGKLTRTGLKNVLGHRSYAEFTENGRIIDLVINDGFFNLLGSAIKDNFNSLLIEYLESLESQISIYLVDCPLKKYDEMHKGVDSNFIEISEYFDEEGLWDNVYHFINLRMQSTIKDKWKSINNHISKYEGRADLLGL